MRILSVSLKNFASYKELDFDFTGQGLTAITGETGSGKSTLCDAVPWILFGKTAKGGAVDEVISWNGTGTTVGKVTVQLSTRVITICRTRGPNDLHYYLGDTVTPTRGKDVPDTQKRINQLLGMDYDLYLSGAYLHEFSQTSQFFTTTPKNRRAITEQLVDLSLPIKLTEAAKLKKKQVSEAYNGYSLKADKKQAEVEQLDSLIDNERSNIDSWGAKREGKLDYLKTQLVNFDRVKRDKIDTIGDRITGKFTKIEPRQIKEEQKVALEIKNLGKSTCDHCGNLIASNRRAELMDQLHHIQNHNRKMQHLENEIAMLEDQLIQASEEENTYADQIASLRLEQNPHNVALQILEAKSVKAEDELEHAQELRDETQVMLADIEALSEVIADFRSTLIQTTVSALQSATNDLLERHFDSELRIALTTEAADKLDVQVTKDGNDCSYTQLSKGQRRILNLAFGVAVMKLSANNNNLKFSQIFFDESLDGLSDQMKLKAFALFTELAVDYESVFVVEHSEAIKAAFNNAYHATLVNEESTLEKR